MDDIRMPNSPADEARIGFRRLAEDDLPLMHRWLHAPHVHEWWSEGKPPPAYEEVVAKYSPQLNAEDPTDCYVILHDGNPIGFIQVYMIADHPEYAAQVQVEPDAAGVDLFIGEEAYVHRGLGSAIMRAFLRQIVFGAMGAGRCIIGPDERNAIAIRAYEKAGFHYLKTVQIPDEDAPEYLMVVTATDL
jgi:RimJ/RimL family protein N-acetyltransferase